MKIPRTHYGRRASWRRGRGYLASGYGVHIARQEPGGGLVTPDPLVVALAAERERRGLTQTQVADLGGLHRSMVSLIEGGHRNPRLSTLLRYARGVGVGVEMVMGAGEVTPSDEETAP